MSFPVEIILRTEKKEGVKLLEFQEQPSFPQAVASEPTVKEMWNLMARCITYFTMLVDILIIKNAKAVSVILLTGNSSLTDDVFYTSFIYSQHVSSCSI